eukprot:TRINITY_DN1229_c0_g2_i5.p2 TRINITY_DN1229_c0_g2~~TRINITY_DN1229_c0_g2_i5.p2  ORF type:complete len:191 (-),score=78.85 TRINITY_DN1229_c0_g2_i5:261-833(-)
MLDAVGSWDFGTDANGDFYISNGTTVQLSLTDDALLSQGLHITAGELSFDGIATLTGVFTSVSDRTTKRDFRDVDEEHILQEVEQLPLSYWKFKKDVQRLDEAAPEHMGPMAQDFAAAFHLNGATDTSIAHVDVTGVAFASVKALAVRLQQQKEVQQQQIEAQQQQINTLQQQFDTLSKMMEKMSEQLSA